MIQKPIIGGDVVINSTTHAIGEGESWINFASKWQHSSTPVIGDRSRIVLSMGNYVENQQALDLFKQFTKD
jgi:hypothetical protein